MPRKRLLLLWVMVFSLLSIPLVFAQESPDGFAPPQTVTVAGTVQSVLGCPGDWAPDCEATFLTDQGDGIWMGTFTLPAGSYEYKIALNGDWEQNYGADAVAGGTNISLVLAEEQDVTFTYDHNTGIVTTDALQTTAEETPETASSVPDMVNIPGTLQAELGCPGPWQPDCEATTLEYFPEYDVWLNNFEVPAGSYEYKVALNGSWSVNYGSSADQDGPNITLNVAEDTTITFVYDDKTNWIADDVRFELVTAPGSYQDEIGCSGDWQPECMRSWLQDIDGDGIYTFSTSAIPAGDYEAKAAVGRSWDENYGLEGALDGANIPFSVPEDNTTVSFTFDTNLDVMVITVGGGSVSGSNLREQRAHWVLADTILWNIEPDDSLSYRLLYSENASMQVSLFGLTGEYNALELSLGDGVPAEAAEKFPHLSEFTSLHVADADLNMVPGVLKSQFAVAAFDGNDNLVDITGLQIPGVLDDLFTYNGPLGVNFDTNGIPSITVWAPTAQNVVLELFADSDPTTEATVIFMSYNAATGTWRAVGSPAWKNQFYQFAVDVFVPSEGAIVTNRVTDPYSFSLSMNSQRSQIVNLNDADLKPDGWDTLDKPELDAPEDITIYELHIRDFSALDESVPEDLRGTYLAFTLDDSAGINHLRGLEEAGLTHLHLLPSFDIATINENRGRWFTPDYEELAAYPTDSEEQQATLNPIRDLDGFNWGYDPYHFLAPEGSYSTDPDGSQRILEYRQMVQALNEMGLRVVQDVVFNHTNASGQSSRSVLDRIVPGYYHRLNDRGGVWTSTCCPNTATEHNMMLRLMIDTVLMNAIQYKIDAFRFDLMGHHMKEDMIAVRAALDSLTIEEYGVDGSKIYVYGEGWNFGEVANNARGINATQINMAGTGIGTFNDRLRDAVRGGSPFGGQLEQGLSSMQYVNPNGLEDINADIEEYLLHADHVRIGLAGNLAGYTFVAANGEIVDATQILYGDAPTGYTADPQENIIYVSKHDNETLFDEIIYKAPRGTSMEDRVRMQNLGLSFIAYSQGIPFFHAGSDMLRSKSMDRNSYNSGDWFNRLDFTYQTNNFGVGLPPAADNQTQWEIMAPLLADEGNVPGSEAIQANVAAFRDMLQVRYSTPLFRLRTAAEIQERLAFHNTGPDQVPGLIVMSISDTIGEDLDPAHDMVVVVFNTSPETMAFTVADLAGVTFDLHPVLAQGSDTALQSAAFNSEDGTFTVPALSAAVFVAPQS